MSDKRKALVEKIRVATVNALREAYPTEDYTERDVFESPGSLRLTYGGSCKLTALVEHYKFDIDSKQLKARHYIGMGRNFKYPFYVGKQYIILTDSHDASWISLAENPMKGLDLLCNDVNLGR